MSNSQPEIDPRLYMAAERTFLAWIRTGIALMGFGFVIARFGMFLREMAWVREQTVPNTEVPSSTSFSMWIGTALIGVGILLNIFSVLHHQRYVRALDRNDFRSAFNTKFAAIIAVLLAFVGLSMAVYLLQL